MQSHPVAFLTQSVCVTIEPQQSEPDNGQYTAVFSPSSEYEMPMSVAPSNRSSISRLVKDTRW